MPAAAGADFAMDRFFEGTGASVQTRAATDPIGG